MRIFSTVHNLGTRLKGIVTHPKVRAAAQAIAYRALRAIATLGRVIRWGWGKVTRQAAVGADQTIDAAKVVFDVLFPKSPLNVGVEIFGQAYQRLPIDGDGHCCFRALAFGLLYNLQQSNAESRESTVRNFIASAKDKLNALSDAESIEVRALSTAKNIQATLGSLEQALLGFLQQDVINGTPEDVLQWTNDEKAAHFIVIALRTLCSLYGLFLQERNNPELFVFALKEGSLGIEATGVEDYAEKMLNADTEKAPIRYGGHVEISGFYKLFDIPVDIFSLNEIGKEYLANSPLPPAQIVERHRQRNIPPQSQFPQAILLVHHRIHYDAAVPLLAARANELQPNSEPSASEASTSSQSSGDLQDPLVETKPT